MTHYQLVGDTSTGRIFNLTPHPITLPDIGVTIPPSGTIARVAQVTAPAGILMNDMGNIPLTRSTFGDVQDLPAPFPGDYFIVSAMVRAAVPNRKDVLSPSGLVRDDKGAIIGCKSFDSN